MRFGLPTGLDLSHKIEGGITARRNRLSKTERGIVFPGHYSQVTVEQLEWL